MQITEYLEPYKQRNTHVKPKTETSDFLGQASVCMFALFSRLDVGSFRLTVCCCSLLRAESFYTTPYPQIARKA